MKIMDKIRRQRERMLEPGGQALAERFQRESVAAILKGSESEDWEIFMRNFHSNSEQLQRLLGKDDKFMNPESWGPVILGYIAGSGPCGGGTNFSMAIEMPVTMQNFLDDGVSSDTRPDDGSDPVSLPEISDPSTGDESA